MPENPFFPQLMPAIDFQGADAGVVWTDFSPRIGATYDLKGDGKTVVSRSYATYYGQMAPGQLSSQLAATGAVFVRYPWTDTNGDEFVQAERGQHLGAVPEQERRLRPGQPDSTPSPTRVDPDVQERPHARVHRRLRPPGRFADGVRRQLHLAQVRPVPFNDRDNWTSANYRAVAFTPTGCPAGARCETVTYFEPTTPAAVDQRSTRTIPDR